MIIYKVTNLVNNKVYIGQDSNDDVSYYGSGTLIIKAIKKYGKVNFCKEILEICETQAQLNEREIYWINFLKSTDRKIGYNLMTGGKQNGKHSESSRNKMSVSKKKFLEENGSTWNGRKHKEFSKLKMKETHERLCKTKEGIEQCRKAGAANALKTRGVPREAEVKKKISSGLENFYADEENLKALTKRNKEFAGSIVGIEHHKKLGEANRLRMLENRTIFQLKDNIMVGKWQNTFAILIKHPEYSASNILACAKGKRNSAYGYQWKYGNI